MSATVKLPISARFAVWLRPDSPLCCGDGFQLTLPTVRANQRAPDDQTGAGYSGEIYAGDAALDLD